MRRLRPASLRPFSSARISFVTSRFSDETDCAPVDLVCDVLLDSMSILPCSKIHDDRKAAGARRDFLYNVTPVITSPAAAVVPAMILFLVFSEGMVGVED